MNKDNHPKEGTVEYLMWRLMWRSSHDYKKDKTGYISTSVLINPLVNESETEREVRMHEIMNLVKTAIINALRDRSDVNYDGPFGSGVIDDIGAKRKCTKCGSVYFHYESDAIPPGYLDGGRWGDTGWCGPCDTVYGWQPDDIPG